MNNTHVLVLADESTSMLGVAPGVRAGINTYLDDLSAADREYLVTLVTFSEIHRRLCVATPADDVPRLDTENYRPNGNTALLDAIGYTLLSFDATVEKLDVNDQVLFLLATDGAENASTNFHPEQILEMIALREDSTQWTFIHLAAGREAAEQGLSLGLRTVIAIAQADLARKEMYDSIGAATFSWADGADHDQITSILTDSRGLVGERR